MHLPSYFSLSSLPALPPLPPLPSLSSLRSSLSSLPSRNDFATALETLRQHPKMLSIATLFDDEQQLLNRLWVVLLGLQALLVLFGTISAIVRGVVAMRRSSSSSSSSTGSSDIITHTRRGGLRRTGASPSQYPRHVTIELPATVYEYSDNKTGGYGYEYDQGYRYRYDYDTYDDGYTEAYNSSGNYDEYEHFEKYARSARGATPSHILNSPSSKV